MAKFRPMKRTSEFNLMIALDKKMRVSKDEPNGNGNTIVTVIDGFANEKNEIIVKTNCGKEINSKYLTIAK